MLVNGADLEQVVREIEKNRNAIDEANRKGEESFIERVFGFIGNFGEGVLNIVAGVASIGYGHSPTEAVKSIVEGIKKIAAEIKAAFKKKKA